MSDNAIAVIGYSINVAGSDNADEFYEMISQNKTGLGKSSPDDQREYCQSELIENDNFINIGGGPKDYQTFDEQFFGYSPKEASLLDPQIRKALEHAYLTVEHAGYSPKSLGGVCSCYIASSVNAYFNDNLKPLHDQSSDAEKNQMVFLNESDFLSTRIAYHFNWQGEAYTVKCGCSSSMVAIHEACKSLLQFDSDVALAGGVNIKSRYQYGYLYEEGGILSADGRCCPFSDDASGTVFANGLGFVLLKRLDDAIEDSDTIHAVILSSAVNNDGNDKVGYMAPSMNGQKAAMQTALAFADLKPNQVSYIEAHGTGTTIGDPIEYNGLMKVYGDCAEQSIALRAVKANIGHLDAASGVVSLIKVIEDLKHQTISPMHHFKTLNSRCDNSTNPFDFDTELKSWNSVDGKRIAAVSSFGIGGTNGQLMVADYPSDDKLSNLESPVVIALSAKTANSLMDKISKLNTWLTHQDQCDLFNLSNTLLFGREHFNYRAAWLVQTKDALQSALQQFTENQIIHCEHIEEHPATQTLLSEPSSLLATYLKGSSWVNEDNIIKFKRLPVPGYAFEKHVHWIKPFAFKNQKKSDVSQWFYMPNWQRQEAPLSHEAIQAKAILFFNDESTFAIEYLKRLRGHGCEIIEVLPGARFIQNSNRQFVVSPGRRSDYLNLFNSLKTLELKPKSIVHCWSVGQGNDEFNTVMQLGLYSVLFCTQGMLDSQFTLPQCMQIITNGIANVSGSEPMTPFNATLIGMSQVLPKEMDDVHCQLLDIGMQTNSALVSQQCLFELMRGGNTELALRGRYRFAKFYQPVSLDNDALDKFIIEKGKNYLVIGGLGNFGMELSEFIGAQHGGRVFLSTRMQFPERSTWPDWLNNQPDSSITDKIRQIQAIEQLGAEVHIVRADVCDKASLTALKAYIEDSFGPLSGVVHAAGIVDSGMIAQKTTRSLE